MLKKGLFLTIISLVSLNALTFDKDKNIKIDTPKVVIFKTTEKVSNELVGKITHKKIFECLPSLEGAIQYLDDGLMLYTNDLHKGLQYSCKMGDSNVNFNSGEFKVRDVFKVNNARYLINFNDDVNETEISSNLQIKDANFTTQVASSKSFFINLDKNLTAPKFFLPVNFSSKFGAKLTKEWKFDFVNDKKNEQDKFELNPKAKTLNIENIAAISTNNGKLAARIYIKEWLYDDNALKNFISISGINRFSLSDIGYTYNEREEDDKSYYYYIDIISDEFKPQNSYEITLKAGFGDKEKQIKDDTTYNVKMGNFAPFVEFINDKPYISNVGQIGIKSINVPEIKVVIDKLSDANYRYFLNFDQSDIALNDLSQEVMSKTYQLEGGINEISLNKIKLDFADMNDGIYTVNVYYDKDKHISKQVFFSDIAISAKLSKNELFVFANRLGENTMLANANVKIYGKKNEEIAIGATNDEGVFNLSKKDIYKDAKSVVVSLGKEQNFLILNNSENLNENAQHQLKDANETIDAYIHFASDIIRPNESIKGVGYLRDRNFKPLANMPIKLKITDPQDKNIAEFAIKTNDVGVISFDENITSELSGRFTLSLIYANKKLSQNSFYVESFTPTRIQNQIALPDNKFIADGIITAKLSSNYLFGGAASDMSGTLAMNFYDKEYKNENFKGYKFINKTIQNNGYDVFEKQIKLDKNGKTQEPIVLNITSPNSIPSVIDAVLNFTINDDGKNISTSEIFTLYPYENLVGISTNKSLVEPNEKLNIKSVVLKAIDETQIQKELKFDIKRTTWEYTTDTYNVTRWHKKLEDVDSFVKPSGTFEYTFTQSGAYTIVATDIINGASASIDVDVSGWDYSTLAPTKELNKAQIKLNAKTYKKGDELSADISSVIKDGLALVTLEDNGVKAYKIVKVKNNSANVKFKLDFDFNGLYVGASIYRLTDGGNTPFRTYAKTYANADKSEKNIKLELIANKQAKSNADVNVTIKTEPNADVSLFYTDMGVLNITSQMPSSPFKFFDKKIADSVFDYDFYDKIASYVVNGKILNFGGDGIALLRAAKLNKHESPVDSKNIQTFANLIRLKADENGSVRFKFKTPNAFNSKLRLDAIATNSDKIGSTSTEITVKDDVIIKPSVLSYLLKGDEIDAKLRLINTTNLDKNLTISILSSQNLELETDKNVNLKPLENVSLNLKMKAIKDGAADYNIIVSDINSSFSYIAKLDIINPYPLSTYSKSISIDGKKLIKLPKGFESVNIDASNSIISLLSGISKDLIAYPYGCVEQRSSRILALLNAKFSSKSELDDRQRFITLGMNDIVKMQKTNGSFGYWSELGYTNVFASIYATDVLLELDKAGFSVAKNVKNRAVKSLSELDYDSDFERLYAMYVATKAGAIDRAMINSTYDAKIYTSNVLNRYLMASSLKILGLNDEANAVIKGIDEGLKFYDKKHPSDFHSQLRDRAFVLYLHATHFIPNAYSDALANTIITNLNELVSTQEKAFVLRALNAYFKPNLSDTINKFKITNDNKSQEFTGLVNINMKAKDGKFNIEPLNSSKLFIGISSSAHIPLEPKHKIESKELDIYRTFVDKDGKEIDINSLKINDLIYSKISLSSKMAIKNGVINEMISSCFEAVNENLNPNLRGKMTKNTLNLEYQSIKDDRVISFYNLDEKTGVLFTPYRVVLTGKCTLPATITENMYNDSQNDYDLVQKSFIVK
ncbi:alpha-2-macroglobulin [Campylobacter sp. faydin G-24]|uniref:Alpha-2-macroglobulin n=1 Tax=Campylobacter anatolicus TaxID=2829105 RepID=A0ABS5HHY9_9BACT|nr:MG2 domain-containing protein [Campylobacter anatolicus]MBR8463894.1 alpha-2-macroglobulin [Campylobacter anatolicus]